MEGGRPSGTATVLFTDLVGSTDLLAQLGEDAFDELRRHHFSLLRDALERSGGKEIKTLGDGILGVFGSATDAVACSVAMHQAVDRQARLGPAPLSIRVGIAHGDVAFDEDDVFGVIARRFSTLPVWPRPGATPRLWPGPRWPTPGEPTPPSAARSTGRRSACWRRPWMRLRPRKAPREPGCSPPSAWSSASTRTATDVCD